MNVGKTPSLIFLAMLAAQAPLWASGQVSKRPDPVYAEECGSCHVPYPARLLPAESWRALLRGLDRHFGSDASLEPETAKAIAAYLERNAGPARGGGPAILRITETRWFRHEHDEVPARVWKEPAIGSPARCEACHTGAERGSYAEPELRYHED